MKKFQLQIPTPCHEDWNKMTTSEKGRFCSSCKKDVVDFTTMTDQQIARYFAIPRGPVCGRMQSTQLQKDLVVPQQRINWFRHIAKVVFPMFLLNFKSYAQRPFTSPITQRELIRGEVGVVPLEHKGQIIRGSIRDAQGNAIPGVSVLGMDKKATAITDAQGKFELQFEGDSAVCRLKVSAPGYFAKEVLAADNVDIVLSSALAGLVGRVGGMILIRKPSRPIPLIQKLIDTSFNKFNIYPNPVRSHSEISIDIKKLEKGIYIASLVSATGEIIENREIEVTGKNQVFKLPVRGAAGEYFVNLFEKHTGKSFTSKVMVE